MSQSERYAECITTVRLSPPVQPSNAAEQMPDEQIMPLLEPATDSHFECCLGCCGNNIQCVECSTAFATDHIN